MANIVSVAGVVQQEMLHLSLAGNILRALGGEFKLYDPSHVPVFDDDSKLLYDGVDLHLEQAGKHLIGTFVRVCHSLLCLLFLR